MITILISYLLLAITFIFIFKALSEGRKEINFKKYGTGIPGTRSSTITTYRIKPTEKDNTQEQVSKVKSQSRIS